MHWSCGGGFQRNDLPANCFIDVMCGVPCQLYIYIFIFTYIYIIIILGLLRDAPINHHHQALIHHDLSEADAAPSPLVGKTGSGTLLNERGRDRALYRLVCIYLTTPGVRIYHPKK